MKTFRTFLLLGTALVAAGCDMEKDATQIDDITAPTAGVRIKFANFAVNGPSVHFFANDRRMTSTSSAAGTPSPLGIAYGAFGAGTVYTTIAPGQYTISARLSDTAAASRDVQIASVQATLENGKAYTVYTSGLYNATSRTSEAFIVEDAFPNEFDWENGTVRFVNAISNSQPMQLIVRNTTTGAETAIGAGVAYRSGGAFVKLPPGSYDLLVRAPNGTTNLITRTQVGFVSGRVYTVTARGDMTVTSTTAVNRPFLDNTVNR